MGEDHPQKRDQACLCSSSQYRTPHVGTRPKYRKKMNSSIERKNMEGVLEYQVTNSGKNIVKPELTPERLDELFTRLDLSGTQDWSEDLQQEVHDLMVEYQHLFALNDLELGRTSKVKHEIKLSNPVPFKDRYRQIPPHEFDEVRSHLQDMFKVGAI